MRFEPCENAGLAEEPALLRCLVLEGPQQARLGARRAIGVAGAERLELGGVTRIGGVVQRQREPRSGALFNCLADPVDRRDQSRVVGLTADAERA